MFAQLAIVNFKCFAKLSLGLAPLTVLAGVNGAGKSTIIQALLTIKQTIEKGGGKLELNGPYIDLGSFKDVLSSFGTDDQMTLSATAADGQMVELVADGHDGALQPGRSRSADELSACLRNLVYLSADRMGPRDMLPMSGADAEVAVSGVGQIGEFVAHYLRKHGQDRLPNPAFPIVKTASPSLDGQLVAWFREICPGVEVQVDIVPPARISFVQFGFNGSLPYRARNVGYGLSHTLPVLIALLTLRPNQTLLLESPEAHLHPAGQTAIGRLIAVAAQAGSQVIVETHSDHLLSGIRIAIKEGELEARNARLHFFERGSKGVKIASPRINADGLISSWPEGFFDQNIRNLERLSE